MIDTEKDYMVATQCLTYNQAPFIIDALNGFARQETTFSCVYIIVDDASTDGEQAVLKQWAKAHLACDDGILWKELPYGEIAEAKYVGKANTTFVLLLLKENHYQTGKSTKKREYILPWIQKAKYYAICEGDDYWMHPHKLQQQVEMLENDESVGAVHTDCASLSENDSFKHFINRDKSINPEIDTSNWEKAINQYYNGRLVVRTCTVLIRRTLLEQIRKADPFLFDGHLRLGDTQMWIGILLQQKKIFYWDEETAVYRILKGSASHGTNYKKQLAFAISRYEIRVYYRRKYGILKEFPNIESKYYNYVRIYRFLYDPGFKDIDGNTKDNNALILLLSRSKLVKGVVYGLIKLKNSIRK